MGFNKDVNILKLTIVDDCDKAMVVAPNNPNLEGATKLTSPSNPSPNPSSLPSILLVPNLPNGFRWCYSKFLNIVKKGKVESGFQTSSTHYSWWLQQTYVCGP